MIQKAVRTTENAIDRNGFVARAYFPGHLDFSEHSEPGDPDHGLGPLATIMESFLAPGTHITLHEHVVDEIVSWVPAGVMRHDDPGGAHLTVDRDHLMIMNAGRGFQHEERTRADDPPLRMLQIFVRPPAGDLDPEIQYGRLAERQATTWRPVFGPAGSAAPFRVRNRIHCWDIGLAAGERVALPTEPGHRTYFFVYSGRVAAEDQTFGEAESGLLPASSEAQIRAVEDAVVLAFVLDPTAEVCRGGTVGDGETVQAMAARARRQE
jgi:redox-sensitive bicupin YhaK (pirin superfamily)